MAQDFCKEVRDAVDKEEEVLLEQVGSVVEDSASNLAIVESEGDTTRQLENISRGHCPHRGVDAGHHSCKH